MKRASHFLLGALALVLVMVLAGAALAGQQAPPPPPAQPGKTAPAHPPQPPVNKEEEAAYKAFFELKGEPATVTAAGEEFLKKFPESHYREAVYSRLANGYLQLGEGDKLIASGEKALELNPNNVDALSVISFGLLRVHFNPEGLDAPQKLAKAEDYSKRGIKLLTEIVKPEGITEEDFAKAKNQKLSMCHSGLGLAYLYESRFADAAGEFEQATAMAADPDEGDFYLLGLIYKNLKRPADAAVAYGRCAEMAGQMQGRCKAEQQAAKKAAEAAPKPQP